VLVCTSYTLTLAFWRKSNCCYCVLHLVQNMLFGIIVLWTALPPTHIVSNFDNIILTIKVRKCQFDVYVELHIFLMRRMDVFDSKVENFTHHWENVGGRCSLTIWKYTRWSCPIVKWKRKWCSVFSDHGKPAHNYTFNFDGSSGEPCRSWQPGGRQSLTCRDDFCLRKNMCLATLRSSFHQLWLWSGSWSRRRK
jgi:hypothetical protein